VINIQVSLEMRTQEYLIETRAIHIELARIVKRVTELASFGCAVPTNHAFLVLMDRQTELYDKLAELDARMSSPAPLEVS
jgi:hypothetical protein